jgi:hypothetical protein
VLRGVDRGFRYEHGGESQRRVRSRSTRPGGLRRPSVFSGFGEGSYEAIRTPIQPKSWFIDGGVPAVVARKRGGHAQSQTGSAGSREGFPVLKPRN